MEDLEERAKNAGIEIAVRTRILTDPTNAVRNLKVRLLLKYTFIQSFSEVYSKNDSKNSKLIRSFIYPPTRQEVEKVSN